MLPGRSATTIFSETQRCNIVSNSCNIPILQPCVVLKIVVANRPVYLNYDCEPTNFTFLSEVLLPIMA